MHVFRKDSLDTYVDLMCAGNESDAQYDHNGETWSGPEVVLVPAPVDTGSYQIHMWEDDHDACRPGGGLPPYTNINEVSALRNAFGALWFFHYTVSGGEMGLISGFLSVASAYMLLTALNHDDLVGVVQMPPCWETSTGAVDLSVAHPTNGYEGWVRFDFRSGPGAPLCGGGGGGAGGGSGSLAAAITGSTPVAQYATCTWAALATDGTSPYTYAWYKNGILVGSSDLYQETTQESSFTLFLYIWDSASGIASDSALIEVEPDAPVCLQ
jgi:hypothetical protein